MNPKEIFKKAKDIQRNPNHGKFCPHVWDWEGACNHHRSHRSSPRNLQKMENLGDQ